MILLQLFARAALALTLIALAPGLASAQERILQFISDVKVETNGDLLVTETIRVLAQGREIRRGILRDFPTSYNARDGRRVEVGFDVLSVARDGNAETYATERLSNGVRIRIGSAERTIPTGPHTYTIRYRTTRQIGFFEDYDELYWNATGTGWTFAIDVAEARITLPSPVNFIQTAFYTGPQGAQGKNAVIVDQRPGAIVFRTTRPLPPRQGLTVAAAWQKGVIAPPTQAQLAQYWLRDNLPLAVGLGGLALLIAYYIYAWVQVGRDPRRGTIIPLFTPPKGFSAPAARYVKMMGFDARVFSAGILDLAVHGGTRIVDTPAQMQLVRQTGGTEPDKPVKAMADVLFQSGNTLTLSNSNHAQVAAAKSALRNSLARMYVGPVFANNYRWSAIGALLWLGLTAAVALATLWSHGSDTAGLMLFATAFAAPALLVVFSFQMGLVLGRSGFRLAGLRIGFSGVFAGAGVLMLFTHTASPVLALILLIPALSAPLIVLFMFLLKAPTPAGRKIMDEIEGFKQYLGVAEEERLDYLHPPEKTPQLFERYLPYAVALDVENRWAERFAGVLAAAAASGAAAAARFYGRRKMGQGPSGFANRIGATLASTVASASSPPGSRSGGGSSGGGSSGGGGGGGGGSGW